jgi:BirA family biotin operon repressor/biotin-[acetyl-CoA-carboxylase] ligase
LNTAPPADVAAALSARRDLDWVRLVYVPEVGSTNDVAAGLASAGAPDGTTVLAAHQTAGRGRRGRVWHSPPDAGLYLSAVLRGPQSPLLTLLAGVAVAEAVRAGVGIAADLKWPNDVVLAAPGGAGASRPRKVAGILTERLPAAAGEGAVVGIGINVARAAYPPEFEGQAASLEEAAGRPVDRGPLLAGLLAGIRRWDGVVAADGSARLLDRWRRLSPSATGARVSWEGPEARHDGLTAGIAADGALLVDCRGRTERIVGGEVRWA